MKNWMHSIIHHHCTPFNPAPPPGQSSPYIHTYSVYNFKEKKYEKRKKNVTNTEGTIWYGDRESNSFFKNLYQFIIFQLLLAWLGERRENPYSDTLSSPWKELRLWLRLLWVALACLWLIAGLFRVDPGRIYCVWFKATGPRSLYIYSIDVCQAWQKRVATLFPWTRNWARAECAVVGVNCWVCAPQRAHELWNWY